MINEPDTALISKSNLDGENGSRKLVQLLSVTFKIFKYYIIS